MADVQWGELVPHDKRQLAQLVAAGIASTVFALGMAVAPAPGEAPLPATSLRVQSAATPAVPASMRSVQVAARSAGVRPATRPSASSARAIQTRPPATSVVPRLASAASGPSNPEEHSRRGRIADLLLGDGRYSVRPFPAPGGQR